MYRRIELAEIDEVGALQRRRDALDGDGHRRRRRGKRHARHRDGAGNRIQRDAEMHAEGQRDRQPVAVEIADMDVCDRQRDKAGGEHGLRLGIDALGIAGFGGYGHGSKLSPRRGRQPLVLQKRGSAGSKVNHRFQLRYSPAL